MPDPIAVAFVEIRPDVSKFQATMDAGLRGSSGQGVKVPVAVDENTAKASATKAADTAATSFASRFSTAFQTATGAITNLLGGGLTNAFKKTSEGASDLSEKSKGLSESFTKLVEAGSKVAAGQGTISGFLGLLGGSIPIIGGVIAGFGLLGGLLEHIVNENAEYAFTIEEQNRLLGVNTTLMQTLDVMVQRVGLDHDSLTKILQRFQVNLEDGASRLKAVGVSMQDVGITTTDLNVAIPELSRYLATNSDTAQKNAVAQALLGRGASDLITVLGKGPEAITAYTEELQRNGLIMDDTAIHAGALTKLFRDDMMSALQGLERQFAAPLFQGVSEVFHAITLAAQDGQGAIKGFGQTISDILTNVVSFFVTLVGGQGAVEAFNKSLGDASKAQEGAAVAAAQHDQSLAQQKIDALNAKISLDQLTHSTEHQTAALDAQVNVLNEQQSRYDQNIQDQIQGQRDLVTALDQQLTMQDLLQKQADDTGTSQLAKLKAQLAAVQNTYTDQRKAGETLADYQQRIKEQDLQGQITTEENKRAQAKDTAAIQKEQLKEHTDAVINALQTQQKAYDDQTKAQIKALDAQKTALAQTVKDAQQRYQDLTDTTKADLQSAQTDLRIANDEYTTALSGSTDDFIKNMTLKTSGLAMDLRNFDWGAVGSDIGKAIGSALVSALTSSILGGAGKGLRFIAAEATGKSDEIVKQAVSLIGGASSMAEINVIGQEAVSSNVLSNDQARAVQQAALQRALAIGAIGQAQYQQQIGSLFGGAQNVPVNATARQGGGPVEAFRPYLVGEHGPEIRVFSEPGHIISAEQTAQIRASAGTHIGTVNIPVVQPNPSPDEIARALAWHLKVAS
jgi:hypothetical protein